MKSILSRSLVLGLLIAATPAGAGATFFTTAQLLREFFPSSEKVTYRRHRITAAQRTELTARLGYRPPKDVYVVFIARTGSRVDGYAMIDEERGQHQPISFGVKLSPEGVVKRQEVMVYREAYGGEVVDPRFKRQFEGKSSKDPLRAGGDVDVVTGATISSQAMTIGVRRAIILIEELAMKSTQIPAKTADAGKPSR